MPRRASVRNLSHEISDCFRAEGNSRALTLPSCWWLNCRFNSRWICSSEFFDELLKSFLAVSCKGEIFDEADLLLGADPGKEERQEGRGKHEGMGESGCFVHERDWVIWTKCMLGMPWSRRMATKKRTRSANLS